MKFNRCSWSDNEGKGGGLDIDISTKCLDIMFLESLLYSKKSPWECMTELVWRWRLLGMGKSRIQETEKGSVRPRVGPGPSPLAQALAQDRLHGPVETCWSSGYGNKEKCELGTHMFSAGGQRAREGLKGKIPISLSKNLSYYLV